MYEIDLNTCTARDVIQRSITCHPSLFIEGIQSLADTHRRYAQIASSVDVAKIADGCRDACEIAARYVAECDADAICGELRYLVQAFTVAAKLQCIPASLRGDIIERR